MGESQNKNYNWLILLLSIIVIASIFITYFLPKQTDGKWLGIDLTFFPSLNAALNTLTFLFLLMAFIMIRNKNVRLHRRFVLAACTTTFLFLISYLLYHSLAPSTHYGGEGFLKYFYYFILITHILLAVVVVPLVLITLKRGLSMQVERHRKIARWTMPIWLYVSLTGVLVYWLISPYYE